MSAAKTIKNEKLGKKELRLVLMHGRLIGLADGKRLVEGDGGESEEHVWRRLQNEVGKANPSYFGFDGARTRFLRFFPEGFHSAHYAGEERDYKMRAKERLDETAPVEQAVSASGLGEEILAVFRQTNLLSPFEKVRLQDVLRGPSADEFIRAAARFTLGGGKQALFDIGRALKPHDSAKWTVVTYLPFLWRASGPADVAAQRGLRRLKEQFILDRPWSLSREPPVLDGACNLGNMQDVNARFVGVTVDKFTIWLRNAIAHGDGRSIRPIHARSRETDKEYLVGFEFIEGREVGNRLRLHLYNDDMIRVGKALADNFCQALSRGKPQFGDVAGSNLVEVAA